MQVLYQMGMANAEMFRGISHMIPELNTSSAKEFAATVAWPGALVTSAWGGGVPATGAEFEAEEEGEVEYDDRES